MTFIVGPKLLFELLIRFYYMLMFFKTLTNLNIYDSSVLWIINYHVSIYYNEPMY